jgi:hypothetical protein
VYHWKSFAKKRQKKSWYRCIILSRFRVHRLLHSFDLSTNHSICFFHFILLPAASF